MADEKPLPHDLEAERYVLGSIIQDNKLFVQAAEVLREGDFYREAHRRIWKALRAIDERRQPADLVTLRSELIGANELESVGGSAYIGSLIDGIPRNAPVVAWAKIVQERSLRRESIHGGQKLIAAAYDESQPIEVVLDTHHHSTLRLLEGRDAANDLTQAQVIRSATARIEKMSGSGMTGISTGIEWLDDRTGGLEPGSLVVVAGRTRSGKSALCGQLVVTFAAAGARCRVYSLEMTPEAIGARMLFADARVDRYSLRHGDDTAWGKIANSIGRLSALPITYDPRPAPTSQEISISAHRQASLSGAIQVVVVDHLQRIGRNRRVNVPLREAVGEAARDMKTLARSLDCVVILASQLNRNAEGNEPTLAELKETGSIEEEADIVLALHPDPKDRMSEAIHSRTKLMILKNREGYEGSTDLTFLRPFVRFDEPGAKGVQ